MNGARFKWSTGLASLALAAFAFGGPAQAADLGGDCCADLEERIAELEATTVRKGNRKVSLTVTGWVSSAVLFWDDGDERNTYVVSDSTDLASNISFTGSAQISSDWSAGYLINVFFDTANALVVSQDTDDGDFGVNVQRSFWFLKSNTYGKLSVGLQSGAGDNAALGADFSGTLFQHNGVTFELGGFALRPEGGTRAATGGIFVGPAAAGLASGFLQCVALSQGIGSDCLGDRSNAVRYDTPTFAGFSASASWGEDDQTDIAARYAGEFGGIKVSFAGAYGWVNGDNRVDVVNGNPIDVETFQIGGMVKHLASALWVHSTYNVEDSDNAVIDDGNHWYIKGGWSPKINPLGTTHFVIEYRKNTDTYGTTYQTGSGAVCGAFGASGANIGAACGGGANANINVTGSEVTTIGAGIVQEIDAASMNVYLKYRHYEYEMDFVNSVTGVAGTQDFDDIDMLMMGGFIFF